MQYIILIFLSVLIGGLLLWVRLPAALLFGPMLAAMIVTSRGGKVKIAKIFHTFSQAVIGCLIARALTPSIFATFGGKGPLYMVMVASVVAASCTIGWSLSKLKIFPGTTAVWGLLPGAASAMLIMAEEFGADARLVAFMQYLRVVMVASTAAIIARFWVPAHEAVSSITAIGSSTIGSTAVGSTAVRSTTVGSTAVGSTTVGSNWLAPIHFPEFLLTLALVYAGVFFGARSKLPAGTLLIPMFAGSLITLTGLSSIELPQPLLAVSYGLLGWSIGLRFTGDAFSHTLKVLPQTIGSIVLLILFSGALSCLLVKVAHVDSLTAYLALSPGGMDSIAIITATTKVNAPFIMSLQMVRFLMVLLLGPTVSRFVATRLQSEKNFPQAQISRDAAIEQQVKEDESELD